MPIQYRTDKVTVFESALFRTTSTILILTDSLLIVDPNWLPGEVAFIRQFVDRIRGNRSLILLFTHSDYDHIIAYGAFPEAQVIASKAFHDNPDAAKQVEAIWQFDHDNYIERNYPITYPEVDILIAGDDQILDVGPEQLTFYLAPGHTADGIFTYWQKEGILLVGDYLSNIEFPYIYDSVAAYRKTLAKAKQLIDTKKVSVLIPGHGDVTTSQSEMYQRISESENYIDALENSVRSQEDFPLDALWERYHFRRGMEKFHQANRSLMLKEINGERAD